MGREKLATEKTARYRFRFQYAAKVICTANIPGTSQTSSSVLPGAYQTVVNIHNPNRQTAHLRKKIAVPGPGQVSKFLSEQLPPDEVTKFDCAQVGGFGMHFIHGAEGFLVIESTHSLDVVAIYTAGKHGGEVEGIAVTSVSERRLG